MYSFAETPAQTLTLDIRQALMLTNLLFLWCWVSPLLSSHTGGLGSLRLFVARDYRVSPDKAARGSTGPATEAYIALHAAGRAAATRAEQQVFAVCANHHRRRVRKGLQTRHFVCLRLWC